MTRKVENNEMWFKRSVIQLLANILSTHMLADRIGIDFKRLMSVFITGTLGAAIVMKKVRKVFI